MPPTPRAQAWRVALRRRRQPPFLRHSSTSTASSTSTPPSTPSPPPTAPRVSLDLRHIRENPDLYAASCAAKNYPSLSGHPQRIRALFEEWKSSQQAARGLRERSNALRTQLSHAKSFSGRDTDSPTAASSSLAEARAMKEQLAGVESRERALAAEMSRLAEALPNLVSARTPHGSTPHEISAINPSAQPLSAEPRSHVLVGSELDVLDLAAAAAVSGWGWYFLKNEGALLEHALTQHALGTALARGFAAVSPPSVVYSHVGAACGFRPRDAGGETQTYALAPRDGRPELSLAATAEIPLAGMAADAELAAADLPRRVVAASRCFRAEAGGRGAEAKGLYRVHEFTKVEMFAWAAPDLRSSEELLEELVAVQVDIVRGLGLRGRLLEQPSADLGASAARKMDIEVFFPSRAARGGGGWGEVTSASNCTDYQTRRLNTRVRAQGGRLAFPHTVNGTALAVPRVIAAILENFWDDREGCVHVPEVLWPYMHGVTKIVKKR